MDTTPPYNPSFTQSSGQPDNVERRLTLRLLRYWERLRTGRPMPSENDINPDGELGDMWDDCFLIHVADLDKADYNFIFLGEHIRDAFNPKECQDMMQPNAILNSQTIVPKFNRVLETSAPVLDEGSIQTELGHTIKYRQCLLPLGEGDKILAIFGGMRCKLYS